jgi:hypothetical protein
MDEMDLMDGMDLMDEVDSGQTRRMAMKRIFLVLILLAACAPAFGQSAVADADDTRNRLSQHVLGNKADAAVTTVGSTASLVAMCKGILNQCVAILNAVAAGDADSNVTDNLHGKIGTDTEMGDNSLWDYTVPKEAAGTADIDISEAVYTDYVLLLTITPAAGQSLVDVEIDLDYNLATTGVNEVATAADTLDVCVAGRTDGTNYRNLMSAVQVSMTGDVATLALNRMGDRFKVGQVGVTGRVAVYVKLSAERSDAEIPYRVTYRGAAPTITAVAAV